MGRGRAKAKQTKVARELKYHSPNTDLAALQRELGRTGSDSEVGVDDYLDADSDDADSDDDSDDEEEDARDDGTWAARGR